MHPALPILYQRALALTLLGALVAAAINFAVVPTLQRMSDDSETRRFALKALRHDRALSLSDAKAQEMIASVAQDERWHRLYEEPSADKALNQMENDVRTLLTANNIIQISMTAATPTVHGSLQQIGVKVSLTAAIDQLAQLLAALAVHPKTLQVTSLTVQAPDYQPVDTNPALNVQMEINGLLAADRHAQ